jgi:hypothetical protein
LEMVTWSYLFPSGSPGRAEAFLSGVVCLFAPAASHEKRKKSLKLAFLVDFRTQAYTPIGLRCLDGRVSLVTLLRRGDSHMNAHSSDSARRKPRRLPTTSMNEVHGIK